VVNELDNRTNLVPKLPLSALLVEDNPDDVELCLRVLRKAQLEVKFDAVQTPEDFTERLRNSAYDIILADYNVGTWTGMDALNILQKEGYDIPLILVTGALGDQKAVECIKSGAADYILKDRMERLPVAVSRALEERSSRIKRQQAERLLVESERKFRALADAIPAAVFIEQGTQCHYVNRTAERLVGYSREELLGMNFWQLILPGSRKALLERAHQRTDGNQHSTRYTTRILTKKGEVRLLDVTVGMFQVDGGLAALITAFDISGQKGVPARSIEFSRPPA
jgi:PAS domain S-box-containing protein